MNELEKALEQLNIKYETNGKQYKIPTTKENLVELLKASIAMTINLQSKIDKAVEWLDKNTDWKDFNCRELKFDENSKPEKLLDILKEGE